MFCLLWHLRFDFTKLHVVLSKVLHSLVFGGIVVVFV